MTLNKLYLAVAGLTLFLLGAGVAGAIPGRSAASPADMEAVSAAVASGISYQGRLAGPGGSPLDGTYAMRFIVYNAAVGGSALWDSGTINVDVDSGLFNVRLGVDHADFDGRPLWMSIIVAGETLSPRQEILPAPYALSLRPGADIVGDSIGAADAVVAGYAPATGTALYADAAGGAGLFADSENSYGVWGSSNDSWGGYFTSGGGYGIRVETSGGAHYDHGAYISANNGYGVYAKSASNMGVRGEAGNVSGMPQPLGAVGVVGIGSNRGTYGSSQNGSGLYGTSVGNYGLWGQSTDGRGVTGRTSRIDNNYGFYTPDNLFSANINMAGAIMQVMENGGGQPLSPGDVVVFSGLNRDVQGVDGPIVRVSQADGLNSTAVAGVVYSRFNIEAIDPALESPDEVLAEIEVTPAGSAAPGEFVLVVVQGPAEVKVSGVDAAGITPGDLLATGSTAGVATEAAQVTIAGIATAAPGTVFAKALEGYDGTQEMIYVYVTLQ